MAGASLDAARGSAKLSIILSMLALGNRSLVRSSGLSSVMITRKPTRLAASLVALPTWPAPNI